MWTKINFVIVAVIGGLLGCGTWYTYQTGKSSGMAQVQAQWDQQRAIQAAAHTAELLKAQATQQRLQTTADTLRSQHREETARINAHYDRIVAGLRQRPRTDSPSGVPETASSGAGCTGAGLATADGDFLARYASDAARLQSAYDECKTKYEALQQ